MKPWLLVITLLSAIVVLTVIPVPQITSRGIELGVDQAQALTYRRARVTTRRAYRRGYRRAAYGAGYYGGCHC